MIENMQLVPGYIDEKVKIYASTEVNENMFYCMLDLVISSKVLE